MARPGTVWCEVELDKFARADFDKTADRLWHVRHIPDNGEPHFADGFDATPEPWRGTVHLELPPDPAQRATQLGKAAQRAVFAAEVDAAEAETKRDADEVVALRKAAYDADYDREKTIYEARVGIIKAGLDRAQAGAEYVRNVAAGILAIYQAVLGLSFVAKDRPVQLSAVFGTMFLALAVVSAAAYVAWLSVAKDVPAPLPAASLKVFQEHRLDTFAQWVEAAVLDRVAWIHFAVVCLFLGAIALPLPFIAISGVDQNDPKVFFGMLIAGLAVAVVLTLVTLRPRSARPIWHRWSWPGHGKPSGVTDPSAQPRA